MSSLLLSPFFFFRMVFESQPFSVFVEFDSRSHFCFFFFFLFLFVLALFLLLLDVFSLFHSSAQGERRTTIIADFLQEVGLSFSSENRAFRVLIACLRQISFLQVEILGRFGRSLFSLMCSLSPLFFC